MTSTNTNTRPMTRCDRCGCYSPTDLGHCRWCKPAACPACDYPMSEHIGGKPCAVSAPSTAKSLHDLPIFGWAWKHDAKQVER